MRPRRALGLLIALCVSVPAIASADQYLYKSASDLRAEGVLAIQQHTVFVEIVQEQVNEAAAVQIHQFAAVVALVKRCDQVKTTRIFDNAVLWFNDQFLFGEKQNLDPPVNQTGEAEQPALGRRQSGYAVFEDPLTDNTTESKSFNRHGYGRWVGCHVPRGFLHAIGSDDPYGTGSLNEQLDANPVTANTPATVAALRELITLDNNANCDGCIFAYAGSFYITDPNGFSWLVDKFVYPGVASMALGGCGDASNVHASVGGGNLGVAGLDSGCSAEQHRDTAADDETEPDDENHCFEDATTPPVCDAGESDPTDTPRQESLKVTTLEPLYSVHLQVDPADREGILDAALWAWGTGVTRPGAARYEDATDPPVCPVFNQQAVQAGCPGPAPTTCPVGDVDPRCAIEYSAVIIVDFEAFDDLLPALATDTGEDEISRLRKTHGTGGLDSADESKEGNSHPANPTNLVAGDQGPLHTHDVVALDLFFKFHAPASCDAPPDPTTGARERCGAPRFAIANFVWDPVTGAPPDAGPGDCTTVSAVRTFIVCDTDDDTGDFHAHDGSQTVG